MLHPRSHRLLCAVVASLAALLSTASPALAADGVGLWGRTTDQVITYWGFAVIGLFTILVTGLSLIQIRAENRREREREQLERLRRD